MFQRILWFYYDYLDRHVVNLNWELYYFVSHIKGAVHCQPSLILDSRLCAQICKPIPYLRIKLERRKMRLLRGQIEFERLKAEEKEKNRLCAIEFKKYLEARKLKPLLKETNNPKLEHQNPENAAEDALKGYRQRA